MELVQAPLKRRVYVEIENAVHLTVVAPCLNINVPEATFNIKDHGISPKQTSKMLSDWVSSILSCPAPRQNTQDASVGIPRKQQIRVEISSPDLQSSIKTTVFRQSEVQKKALEQGVTDASADNLRKVGFPEKMWGSPGEISRWTGAPNDSKDRALEGWMLVGYHDNRKNVGKEGDGLSRYKKLCNIFTIKYRGSWNGHINPEPFLSKRNWKIHQLNANVVSKSSYEIKWKRKKIVFFHGLFPEIFDRYLVFHWWLFLSMGFLLIPIFSHAGLRCPWPSCPLAGACAWPWLCPTNSAGEAPGKTQQPNQPTSWVVAGFKYFLDYFHPDLFGGRWRFPFWRAYFSNGLVQPPTRLQMESWDYFCYIDGKIWDMNRYDDMMIWYHLFRNQSSVDSEENSVVVSS